MTNEELLQAYTAELMLSEPITVRELITSHRTIRQENGEMWRNKLQVMAEARNLGRAQGLRQITEEFISWEDLSKMTLAEIIKKAEYYVD